MPGKYTKKAAFKSRKQQKFMFAKHPKIAQEMVDTARSHKKPVVAKKRTRKKK